MLDTNNAGGGADSAAATPLEINSPEELRRLALGELPVLAADIRELLLSVVACNGGHLASNLGAVELTIALHYVFSTPEDKLVWDVGHQAYTHKILTGRRHLFNTLRRDGGCVGFPTPAESGYDTFGVGHAGTAISAALGMAAARDRLGGSEKVVAVVGDGSLNCGISLEGLNNVSETCRDMIIVLNDNKMSISKNVGALTRSLNRMISGRSYNRFKAFTKMMLKRMPYWEDVHRAISKFEEATKSLFVPGVVFEELGLRYIGPIDGHDLTALTETFEAVRQFNRPVIVHVLTEKGRGYHHAEAAPEKFHGLGAFDRETGRANSCGVPDGGGRQGFSAAFGEALVELGGKHPEVCAITAAMSYGTGMAKFAAEFPQRFYDVGIAEEHAVVFACGLAARGMRPVVAMYATFLQRALDYIYHDLCLHNLPVIICCDRAGIVEDGPTHHGIYDLAFLLEMPNLAVLAPRCELELANMLFAAHEYGKPVVIRYPKLAMDFGIGEPPAPTPIDWGRAEVVREGGDLTILAVGAEVDTALACADALAADGGPLAAVVNARFLVPFDAEEICKRLDKPLFTIEDHHVGGGLGGLVDSLLVNRGHRGVHHFGWSGEIIPHGTVAGIRQRHGMDVESVTTVIRAALAAEAGE